jgi:chromatin remodeling complex protein RSC6
MKSFKSQVSKLEKAENKRVKRKNNSERKSNTNSGFQKKHNISGTPLSAFLGEDEASMVDAHRKICDYIKTRDNQMKFPGDGRIIIMDETLDAIFPGLMDNYPSAIELASQAMEEIKDSKERRAYLDENINKDDVLTYSGIMKRLPIYFNKKE